jgi:quinol monooxygenase YgiN
MSTNDQKKKLWICKSSITLLLYYNEGREKRNLNEPTRLLSSSISLSLALSVSLFSFTCGLVPINSLFLHYIPCSSPIIIIAQVFIQVKPGTEAAFLQASLTNARQSVLEPGVVRFDILQDTEDATRFSFYEVYVNGDEAPAAHKETSHFLEWRDAVTDMMAEARTYRRWSNVFPSNEQNGWNYVNVNELEQQQEHEP